MSLLLYFRCLVLHFVLMFWIAIFSHGSLQTWPGVWTSAVQQWMPPVRSKAESREGTGSGHDSKKPSFQCPEKRKNIATWDTYDPCDHGCFILAWHLFGWNYQTYSAQETVGSLQLCSFCSQTASSRSSRYFSQLCTETFGHAKAILGMETVAKANPTTSAPACGRWPWPRRCSWGSKALHTERPELACVLVAGFGSGFGSDLWLKYVCW